MRVQIVLIVFGRMNRNLGDAALAREFADVPAE
jgi:hypothetical protein